MGHGFSLTRADGLAEYAERFAAAGVHVLVFDHRFLGDSGGSPRQRFRIGAQQRDWRSVVAHAKSRPDVDPDRIVLWAYSFAGGHVTSLLGKHSVDVFAAMVLCPFADGLKRVLADAVASDGVDHPARAARPPRPHQRPSRSPHPPAAARPCRSRARQDGFAGISAAGLPVAQPDLGWRASSRSGCSGRCVGRPGSGHRSGSGGAPRTSPSTPTAVAEVASRAPQGELHDFEGDHFAPFTG